ITPVEATYQSNGAALLLFAVLLRTLLNEVPLAKNLAMTKADELPTRNWRLVVGTSMNCCGKAVAEATLFVKWMTGFPFQAPGMRVGKEELNVVALLPFNDWSTQRVTPPEPSAVTPKSAANWSMRPLVSRGTEKLPVAVTTTCVDVVWTPQLSRATAVKVTVPGVSISSRTWYGALVRVANVVPLADRVTLVMVPLAEEALAAKVTVEGAGMVAPFAGLGM